MPGLDPYSLSARFLPSVLVAAPLAVAVALVFPLAAREAIGFPAATLAAVALLVAVLARDAGKRREDALVRQWGGWPTTRRLRHRDARSPVLLAHLHHSLGELLPDVKLPTAEEEVAASATADQVYETVVHFLRETTRDRARFPALAGANAEYGFRRNLWGVRPLGFAFSLLAVLVPLVSLPLTLTTPLRAAGAGVVAALALVGWGRGVTAEWVKQGADAYADRLIGSIELLGRQ